MNTIQYNFKSIPNIPKSTELIDVVLSRTQRKTPTETHPGYKITRIRKFYMRKVKFTYSSIEEKLEGIIKAFPKLDDIHPFYADLINILYDKDHYKMALGYLNTAKSICEKICGDYVKLLKYGDSLYRCKQLKVAALGRMATTLKKLNSSLNYLEEVRKHLGRLPSLDPTARTLLLSGFPNVGKSSFMNKITYAGSEVQPYHFTTQSLFVGHTYYKNIKWQVIDTPGILDRSLEERNIIEMQAITALAHLDACVLYFVDVSEQCGYSIEQQVHLFTSIRPLFKNKPLVIIANKTDLRSYAQLPQQDKEILENAAKEHNTYLIQMSNETGNGVADVKAAACDVLLKYRALTQGANKDLTGMDKVYIAQPKQIRDNRRRTPNIPNSVIEMRKGEIEEEIDEEKYLRDDNIDLLEKKITNNKMKEVIEANGGQGVYFFPVREHFILEKPEWKYDAWPEIMDGKNVFDFVDKDILEKVEKLEEEEYSKMEITGNQGGDDDNNDNASDDSSELDEELLYAHDDMMENQKLIKERHQLVKGSRLPRKLRGETETEKFMDNIRPDIKENAKELKMLSLKRRRDQKDKVKRAMKKEAGIKDNDDEDEKDEGDDDEMDIEDEANGNVIRKKKKLSPEEELVLKSNKQKEKTLERMQRKIQKKWNRDSKVDSADRVIGSKKPKFLNSGHRTIGKTQWR